MEHCSVTSMIRGGKRVSKETEKASFETALKELEEIVKQLEQEDIPLEKAMKFYEKGMKLSKQCNDMLEAAEEKMTVILQNDNTTKPFDAQGE